MKNEVRTVADLGLSHIGAVVRVQTMNGGYVEGTLVMLTHKLFTDSPKGFIQTTVHFTEFSKPVEKGMEYLGFTTIGNREAQVIDE